MILTTIDKISYRKKPQGNEVGIISNRIAKGIYEVNDLKKFADLISKKGNTWCPAVFNNKRSINNFVSTQIISLDFDGGISLYDVLSRSKQYMLPVLFAYETFSSIEKNKFRVVFILDTIITDLNIFKFVIDIFMKIFPECDKSCKDVSRMFFGGKQLIYYNDSEYFVNMKTLMLNFSLYLKDRYGKTHYKAHLKKFNSIHQIYGESKKSPSIVYNENTKGEKLQKNHKAYRKDVLKKLYGYCRLYREFIDDSEWLYYQSLYGLAVNLIHVETGQKTFLKTIDSSKYDTYKHDWEFYMNYFKNNRYAPMKCENFCPYCDICQHGSNMLSAIKIKRKEVVRVGNIKYSGIYDVQAELRKYFYTAANSNNSKINVIKAQTAIGKTHLYIEYLKNTEHPSIIAVPTNKLKNEVYNECLAAGINVIETPSIYEIKDEIPEELYNYIEHLYNTGNHKNVMKYLKSKVKDIPVIKEFIDASKAVKRFNGHIITTHQKVLYAPHSWLSNFSVIIDEDILKTMIKNQISIEISDLEKLLFDYSIPNTVRKHLIKIIELSDKNTLFSVEPIGDCKKVETDFNLNALLNAEKFYSDGKTVVFYNTPELKENIKYTVLSATADEYIYKTYFGNERVEFYGCSTAKYKGKLIQYADNSYSRRYIENNEDTYKNIKNIIGDIPQITFKKYSSDGYGIHFGNSEGCNCMKGQDIAVIGTPHMADFIYKLLAYKMGYSCEDDKLRYQEVTHNNYKFWFYTYENELMRRIQFWMIGSELEQSVGRARLLRENCTVYLFSDFPLMQSEIINKT